MPATIEQVKEEMQRRIGELAYAFYHQLRFREDAAWKAIEERASEKLLAILDRLIDAEEYLKLLETGELDGPIVFREFGYQTALDVMGK